MPPTMLMDALQSVRRRVKWLGVAYGIGLAIAAAIALVPPVNPPYTNIALSRLLHRFGAPSRPKRAEIAMVGNVPTRVPVGQRFDGKIRRAKGARASQRALVSYQLDDGTVQQEYMTR